VSARLIHETFTTESLSKREKFAAFWFEPSYGSFLVSGFRSG